MKMSGNSLALLVVLLGTFALVWSAPSNPLESISAPKNATNETDLGGQTTMDEKKMSANNPKMEESLKSAGKERQGRFFGLGMFSPFYNPYDYYNYNPYAYYYNHPNPYHITGPSAPNCGDSYPYRRYSCYGLGR